MEYLENQSRRNNIRIDGIPEEPDETWEDTESKAKVALESKLNLPFKVEIERAHRTGKVNRRSDDNASSTRPRTVICRLSSLLGSNLTPLVSSPVFPCLPLINMCKGRVYDVTHCYNLGKKWIPFINMYKCLPAY